MWHVILRNKNTIKDSKNEIKDELHIKTNEDTFEFTKTDVIAMIIAAYQLIIPMILVALLILLYLLVFF